MEVKPGYKQTEVGVIPADWQTAAVADLVEPSAPICYGVVQVGQHIESGVPIVAIKFVKEIAHAPLHRTAINLEQPYARSRPKGGDILISIKGTIGRVGIVPNGFQGNISRELARLRVREDSCPEYIAHQLESGATQERIMRSVVGTTRLEFSIATLRKFSLPIPPTKKEQRAIADALSDVDGLLGGLDRLIAKKRDLKQAAMQQLLTGSTRLPGFHGEWEVMSLPEVSAFRGGKAHEQYIAEHGRFICVNSKFISTEGKVRKYATKNFCCAKAKDILMVMSDLPNGKALAKTFVADRDNLYAVNQRVCALTPFDNYCAEFLAYILDRNPYFLKFDDGVSQTHLLNRVFKKCSLFVPPTKTEQTAIAEVLTEMDAELATLAQRREKTRALKQAMMQELLTGKTRLIAGAEVEVTA